MDQPIKIRDALKNEYPDFCEFCESLDKQFVSELTKSDYIAFRVEHGVNREYVASIQFLIDHYDPATIIVKETKTKPNSEDISDNNKEELSSFTNDDAENMLTIYTSEANKDDQETEEENTFGNTDQRRKQTDDWENREEEIKKLKRKTPLYDLFHIRRRKRYKKIKIDEIGLTVRTYNCLNRKNVETLDDLFGKTLADVSGIANLGKKSLYEIIDLCKTFPQEEIFDYKHIFPFITKIVRGSTIDTSKLNKEETKYIHIMQDAREVIGEEMCVFALNNPSSAKSICEALESFTDYDFFNKAELLLKQCSNNGISTKLHIYPFLNACKGRSQVDLVLMMTVFAEDDVLEDIPSIFEKAELNPQAKNNLADSIIAFLKWLTKGINDTLHTILTKASKNERESILLHRRQEGQTLAQVGEFLNISRERIRQIEKKVSKQFFYYYSHTDRDIVFFAQALLYGDMMIHKHELASCIENKMDLDLFWFLIASGLLDCKDYKYSKDYKAILFNSGSEYSEDKEKKLIDTLPSYVAAEDMEAVIQKAIVENGAWEEKLRFNINKNYEKFGSFYCKCRPTVVFICDWVLKNRFSSGYKVNDETDYKRAIGYIDESFGGEFCNITARALDAKIGMLGVLCERGKYLHPSAVAVDKNILHEIDLYIAESPKKAISFIELFEIFKDRLAGTQISNHYFLQGVMKIFGDKENKPCDYYVFRDYITKDPDINMADEFDAFIRERGIVYKSEIFAEFPALNDFTIGQIASRCPLVFSIDNGNYIHASRFDIRPEDYAPIKAYLTHAVSEFPVNIRAVYDECSILTPDFIDRNGLTSCGLLFAALNYMFGDEFRFSRPYIAKPGDEEITNRSVILSLIEPYDEIAISEVISILDEKNIHYSSVFYLLQMIAPHFIRVDEETLMKRELTGIDDAVVEEALNILNEAVKAEGFIASSKVDDFIWYPSIDISWTPYLLECIVGNNDIIDYINYPSPRANRFYMVYVDKKYQYNDYQSFILRIIEEEYDKGSFANKDDMRDWLVEKGLYDTGLPSFLRDTQYYYMDGNRLVKREDKK